LVFSNRIDLISSTGRRLTRLCAAKAQALLLSKAVLIEQERNGRVLAVRICPSPSPIAPPTPLSAASYLGQRYSFRERVREGDNVVARVWSPKPLSADEEFVIRHGLADVCKVRGGRR
jgi:hypothetical protein